MSTLGNATWSEIEAVRDSLRLTSPTLVHAAQELSTRFRETYASVVLARMFAVTTFATLPEEEQRLVGALHDLPPDLPILTLLGTSGVEPEWCDRKFSKGHRAIALRSAEHVNEIPMVAKLLADLQVDLSPLGEGRPIETRRLAGSSNNAFFVSDAQASVDSRGRHIIAARDFVTRYGVRTVFGMGGAYADGTLVAFIVFSNELIAQAAASRFASLIGSFKIATAKVVADGKLFA